MDHFEEYKTSKTIGAWTERKAKAEFKKDPYRMWSVLLRFKDVKGQTTLVEKVAIEIEGLLSYNNVDSILQDEIMESAQNVINLVNANKAKK